MAKTKDETTPHSSTTTHKSDHNPPPQPPSDNKAQPVVINKDTPRPEPHNPPKASTVAKPEDQPLDTEVMAEDLNHGEKGFIVLDEVGRPQGSATKEPPLDTPVAPVLATKPPVLDALVTPSGAPITAIMNPSSQTMMDDGFLARNPVPPKQPDEIVQQVPLKRLGDAPVINEPVRS